MQLITLIKTGLNAYAYKQAALYERLASNFVGMWFFIVKDQDILDTWETSYHDIIVEKREKLKGKGKAV